MPATAAKTLQYDWSGSQLEKYGIRKSDVAELGTQLEAIRDQIVGSELELFHSGTDVPADRRPLDAGFVDMPERILAAYEQAHEASEFGRILATAKRIRGEVDNVVVLGIGGSYMGARALMEGCCHPYHNLLKRTDRGGNPRIFFEGNNVDNDAAQGLLDVLRSRGSATAVEDKWAIVVISKSGGTLETAASFRIFFDALVESCGGDTDQAARLTVPITGDHGKLFDLAEALGCPEQFRVPDGVGGRFSILSAVGLLPAALLGIDVAALLRGAVALNGLFQNAPSGENPVLNFVAVCHLMEKRRGANLRILSVWSKSLESVGLWYDQLLAESLGKQEQGATPLTVVNTRDLHSRAQQHQEGTRDKLITNVIVENWRRDWLKVPTSQNDQDGLNSQVGTSLPEIMTAAINGTNQAYKEDNRCTADIRLPAIDESSLGQLFQMLMLATVVEGRLISINPYGQPGVEAYKKNMQRNLGIGQ